MLSSTEVRGGGGLPRLLEHLYRVERAVPASRAAFGLCALLQHRREQRGSCRVALPAAICHDMVVSILAAGCEPVFCDVDPRDGLVPEAEWSRARALGADAAIVVHLYGNPADASVARRIFPGPDCLLIDDAAQALGSTFRDAPVGAGGDVGLLSFGPTKQLPIGQAALLFRDVVLAELIAARMARTVRQSSEVRDALADEFRRNLDFARERLRASGRHDGFLGLLEGLAPVLAVADDPVRGAAAVQALGTYPAAVQRRMAKKELWRRATAQTALQPVGMGEGCVPWRFVCRLPGIGWAEQHRIAEELRGAGMHVSNWYLPAHWFLEPGTALPGVETLAREVFQFWLDEATTPAAIEQAGATIASFGGLMT